MAKAKGMKATKGNKNVYVVRCYGEAPVQSERKMKVQLESIDADAVVLTMKQPRSSKRVRRMIPRDEFTAFHYNEDTGEVSFILPAERTVVAEVVGTIELNGGYVYVTAEDGTISIFHEEDCEILADAGKQERKPRKEKGSKRRAKAVEEDEDDDDSDDDEDDEDSDDDEESDDSDDSDDDEDDEESDDEDSDDEDEDSDDEESDDDDDEDEDSDDEESDDDSEDDEDDEDSDDDDDDDEDDEDEDDEPKKGRGRGRRGRK